MGPPHPVLCIFFFNKIFLRSFQNILHIGVCIPRSCTNDELHNLTARYFDENLVLAQDIYEFKPNVLHVKNTTLDRAFWSKPSVFIIG